jgi:tRNA threonylcarbamoyladenosine biosynthesis protein TsaB
MKILAMDCSTEACSVALLNASSSGTVTEVVEQVEQAARQHTQRLLPMVAQLLADTETTLQQLDAIAFGRGPGSFTGLRICLGAVQGLAFGADLPVVPVSSLAAQAQSLLNQNIPLAADTHILSTLDARMNEVYWAVYKNQAGRVELLGTEHLSAPEQLLVDDVNARSLIAVGSGVAYQDRIPEANQFSQWQGDLFPSAAAIAELAVQEWLAGNSCAAAQAMPTYLRDEVAWQKQPLIQS